MLIIEKKPGIVSAEHNGSVPKDMYKFNKIRTEKTPLWKLCMDYIGAALCLIVFSPVMLAVALAIKIADGGPVMFKQVRIGKGGRPFTMYKFSSMVPDAEEKKQSLMELNERDYPAFKMKNDPRITPVGKFIRKWSLDELPQFINVLKGEMSLVGPRPNVIEEVAQYEDWYYDRLKIRPGITGLWQATSRDRNSFEEWMSLDITYVKTYSPLLDVKILLLTIPTVLSAKGSS
jgi:lipopolysaccharide/colanic/teichoic acid biosynthesis glycosyltransferase